MAKKAWLSALLNFVLLGAGYIYNGRRVYLGVGLTLAAILATWVEMQIKVQAPALYLYAFAQIFIMAVVLAVDGYKEAKWINKGR